MLGKGLESLIPPQRDNGQSQKGDQDAKKDNSTNFPSVSRPTEPSPVSHQPFSGNHPTASTPQVVRVNPEAHITPKTETKPQKKDDLAQESIFHIEIEKITSNPNQPRRNFDQDALKELAGSIREFGFLQPLVVSQIKKETATGIEVEYQLIAGERRYMAAKMLGLPRVPAIIRNVNLEREKLELGVIENIQRENLNPIEMARAFQRLQEEFRMTQREIAAKLGKSREVVANSVRLLDLPEYIQLAVQRGELSESHARLLISIEDPGAQRRLVDDILKNKLTTRDVKERVQTFGGARRGRPPQSEEKPLPPELQSMQEELSTSLGAPVQIHKGASNGKITITFFSEEELENILRRLGGEERI